MYAPAVLTWDATLPASCGDVVCVPHSPPASTPTTESWRQVAAPRFTEVPETTRHPPRFTEVPERRRHESWFTEVPDTRSTSPAVHRSARGQPRITRGSPKCPRNACITRGSHEVPEKCRAARGSHIGARATRFFFDRQSEYTSVPSYILFF